MFKRMFGRALIILLFSLSYNVAFAVAGNLFKVTSSGGGRVSITLCLTIKGQNPLSCQNYITQAGTLTISTTVPNHIYHHAGIRINTPGFTFTPVQGFKASKIVGQDTLVSGLGAGALLPLPTLSTQPKVSGSIIPTTITGTAPQITSAASASFTYGAQSTFTVTATGSPAPVFTQTGALPAGVTLNSSTGVLSGIPTASGSFAINIIASNGILPNATQPFTLTVSKLNQTISFTAPTNGTAGSTYTPSATASSGLPVRFTIDGASSANTCIITAGIVSYLGAGSCIISANQAGNTEYAAAPQVQQTVIVSQTPQTISFTAPTNGTAGGTYTPSATASSGLPVMFTIDGASSAGACTIAAGVVHYSGTGMCIIDANQPGNTAYTAASQVQQTVTVGVLATTTVLSSSLNPSTDGTSVTFTANIVGSGNGEPISTGTVGFTANAASIGCDSTAVDGGIATCIISMLPDAPTTPNTIIATYSGATDFSSPSISATFNQYVTTSLLRNVTVPATPMDVTTVPGDRQVTVSWFPPTNTGGVVITGYRVNYGATSGGTFMNPGCTTANNSCVIHGLANATSYTFTVAATNTIAPATLVYGPVAYSSPVTPFAALSASPSTLALSALGGGGGQARTMTITNTSVNDVHIQSINIPAFLSGKTSTTCPESGTFTAGATCTIVITPGTTVSSDTGYSSYTACTDGTALVSPSEIDIIYDGGSVLTADVVVLGYGCQYQGGFIFSIDDTTPLTSSIGGTVAAAADGPYFGTEPFIQWSYDAVSIWGVSVKSTIASPDPGLPGIIALYQLNCNGDTDGSCDTNNIYINYSMTNPQSLDTYAAGNCKQPIDTSGGTPCSAGLACYTDWYLPSFCEMGTGGYCTVGIDNMDTNLSFLRNSSCVGSQCFLFDAFYWSSSENDFLPASAVWIWHFVLDLSGHWATNPKGNGYHVRCARALTL